MTARASVEPAIGTPILIWGAGAIGGTIGAYLVRAGYKVSFVDLDAAHVAKISAGQLAIDGPIDQFTVGAPAFTPDQVEGKYDLIVLAVKAMATPAATTALAPHLTECGAVASFQNGLNEFEIAKIVGRQSTIGAFLNFGADWVEPGRIFYGGRGAVVVGELDGTMTPRIRSLHRAMLKFEANAVLTDNIVGYLWGKLAYGAVLTASSLTNDTVGQFMASSGMRPMLINLISEVLAVAEAEGVVPMGFQTFDVAPFLRRDQAGMSAVMDACADSRKHSAKVHTGIWRDLAVRKRKTEVAVHYGPIQAFARRHGLATPTLDRLVQAIAGIENGKRTMGTALAEEVRDGRHSKHISGAL